MEKKKKKIPTIELGVNDFAYTSGINALSFVTNPAIEEDFMYFNAVNNVTLSRIDGEKRVVTGPVVIPDKLIYRFNEETGEEFNIFFSVDTIEQIAKKFAREKKSSNATVQHEEDVDGTYVFETWLVADANIDKAAALGYKVPVGTLMMSSYIQNDELWEKIKSEEVKGYSLEGAFLELAITMNKETPKAEEAPAKEVEVEAEVDADQEILDKIIALLSPKDEEIIDKK